MNQTKSVASSNPASSPSIPESRDDLLQRCEQIARSKSVPDLFIKELNRTGLAGEERASRLIFLALTSRLLDTPVSLAIKGPSSAGKSYTAQETLKFFPPESYHALSAMSERALAYSKEPLKHRFLVLYEAEGMKGEMASYLIRSLLSEGCVRYETVVNTSEGLKPQQLYKEGPTGLLTTTTRIALHAENETRLISVPVNDSPEQTRRIMLAMASQEAKPEIDYAPWHSFQHWLALGANKVRIPFGEKLANTVDCGAVRSRRDFAKLLTLIRTHALIHQQNREHIADDTIVASLQDYAAVHPLIADLFAEAAEKSVNPKIRETVVSVAALLAASPLGVSVTAMANSLGIDKSSASRRADAAAEKGYLLNEELRKGFPAKYVLGEPVPDEQTSILPEVEAITA